MTDENREYFVALKQPIALERNFRENEWQLFAVALLGYWEVQCPHG